ncbi:MAG: hypothetical protein AAGI28_08170 [Pseudomonadota bacterium]
MIDQSTAQSRAVTLLLLGFAGLLGLIGVENARGMEFPQEMGMVLPIILAITSVPIVLLCVWQGAASRWIALIIAALLALFHALHVVEHGTGGDWSQTLLIFVAMFVPNAVAVWLLWKSRAS